MPIPVRRLEDEFDLLHPNQKTAVRRAVAESVQSGREETVTCLTGGTATALPGQGGTEWFFDKAEENVACGTWRETP
jgi:hypothetical protein